MQNTSRNSLMRILVLSSSVLILSLIMKSNAAKLAGVPAPASSPNSTPTPSSNGVYIVYTEAPMTGVNPKAFHLKILSSVYGSEEAAKRAFIYSYNNSASGFSARLTPQQALQLAKQAGVLSVVPSGTVQTHYRTSNLKV